MIALFVSIVGISLLVMPIVSLVMAKRARAHLKVLSADHEMQDIKLTYLYEQVSELKATIATLKAAPFVASPEATSEPMASAADTAPSLPAPDSAETQPASVDTNAPITAAAKLASTIEPSVESAAEPEKVAVPQPPPKPAAPPVPLEERIATLFTRVGAGALVLGILYFFKYAVDNEWIGPAGRVLAGVTVGLGIIVGAEVIRAKSKSGYVHALSGVGLAILYVSAYASATWYDLVGIEVAFGAIAIILALGAALAWRYSAEAVLVLVLLAGLATPKLLSTGHDRPFALFAYLLLLTSAVLLVSLKRHFKYAIGIAVAGVHLMSVGWYGTFFEVHDSRTESWAGDQEPGEMLGAYNAFGPRIVPLVFAALFGAQWIFTAIQLHKQDGAKKQLAGWVVPLATIATVFWHCAACGLLYDRPLALGIAIVAVGAASVGIMRYLAATRWLMVSMAAAFVLLMVLSQQAKAAEQTILLVLIGLWTAAYVAAFLKDALGGGKVLSRADAIRTQFALLGFSLLTCMMLLPKERAYAAAGAITLATGAAVFVAVRARQPVLLLVGQAVSLGGLLLCAGVAQIDTTVAWHPAMLTIAAVWAGLHIVGALKFPEDKRVATTGLFALSGALLGALAIAILTTHPTAATLRSLLTGATGIAALGLATALTKRGATYAHWTSTLAALTLGLFATAIAFGLSGAPVTVLWAALAAIAGTVVARARTKVWLFTFQLLVVATLWRLAAVDIAQASRLTRIYFATNGAEGVLSIPTLFNPRAYALFGTGIAFLVGAGVLARSLRKTPASWVISASVLLTSAGAVAVLGYALLTTGMIIEIRAALTTLPPVPPMVLDYDEFRAFWDTVEAAHLANAATLDVVTTVILGVVGVALVAAGFAFNDPFHRYLGLLVLLLTVGKLVTWDVWKVSRIYRVVVLTSIGALLLISGFLYARLKVLFTKGSISTGAGLLLLGLSFNSAQAEPGQLEVHHFRHVAEVQGVQGAGDHRLVIPAELYDKSLSTPPFADLRLTDAQGRLVPYVIQSVPPPQVSGWTEAEMFDSGELPGGGSRALFEVPEGLEHCEIRLKLKRQGPYLRRTKIETGASQDDLQTVASGAIVYYLNDDRASRSNLRYPRSIARYLRVTLQADPDARSTKILGASLGCHPPQSQTPRDSRALTIIKQETLQKSTSITLDVGQSGLPIDRLELTVAEPGELVRRVEVQSSAYEKVWPGVGSGVLYRVAGAAPSEDLSLSVRPAKKRWFKLEVENRDNPPLKITGVQGSWPRVELLFRTSEAGPVRLYIGQKLVSEPSFDLKEILARRTDRPNFAPATVSAAVENPAFGKPDVGRKLPVTERYRTQIGMVLAVLLLGLGIWAIRLVKSGQPETD